MSTVEHIANHYFAMTQLGIHRATCARVKHIKLNVQKWIAEQGKTRGQAARDRPSTRFLRNLTYMGTGRCGSLLNPIYYDLSHDK